MLGNNDNDDETLGSATTERVTVVYFYAFIGSPTWMKKCNAIFKFTQGHATLYTKQLTSYVTLKNLVTRVPASRRKQDIKFFLNASLC